MTRFIKIAANLAFVLGLTMGFALINTTAARGFVLQIGSILVTMVFPFAVLIMLLLTFFDDGRSMSDMNVRFEP